MLKEGLEKLVDIFLFTLVFLFPLGIAGNIETHYNMEGVISSIKNEKVYVIDAIGETWSFKGDGYKKGDKVEITFFTSYTDDTRDDDEIDYVKKI